MAKKVAQKGRKAVQGAAGEQKVVCHVISVAYGVHRLSDLAMTGKSVAEIRSSLETAMNIDPQAKCVVNGQDVSENYIAKSNDNFEFVKLAGQKG